MKEAAARAVHLKDYAPYPYLLDDVSLQVRLDPKATRVVSQIRFSPNPDGPAAGTLRLDGEGLRLIRATIDGAPADVTVDDHGLTCPAPATAFDWECEVEIAPADNTALEGLYMSNGMYCTQCEAEGFRKITYYPDRPDVMAPFSVRIEADPATCPVLLSNGNPTVAGDGWAEWQDPWPKPAYLFALVAGDLVRHADSFRTLSGREVDLGIWVRPGDEGKCAYAMDALKRSMAWDEAEYGREYDLNTFNIVAVDDFNMGAMENKGLNIFNSKYVLASPETATDRDYEMIEGIIAHEYFHNWTGNRITCRDWFQLCLKEGLTVFRDQQFSGDQRSHAVKRIDDVLTLRARQFREDNGPLSHPVRPESYIEINNFYTATVYEKGAEVIGMLRRLVGEEGYRAALDLYFDRHDGQACTIEDWLRVFEDATGRDLTQFKRWYTQSGTPRLSVREDYTDNVYRLHFRQETPPTPGQPEKGPQVIPVALGLLAPDGSETMPTRVLEITETEQSFTFPGQETRPIPSLLRGFSAPVILTRQSTAEERAFLLAHDTDPFNKWEAGRTLAKDVLSRMVTDDAAPGPDYLSALRRVTQDDTLDPAFRALALALPSDDDMAQTLTDSGVTPDPLAIWTAREKLSLRIAEELSAVLGDLYDALERPGPYSPDPKAANARALRQTALGLLSRIDGGTRAQKQFAAADNMTDELGALACLIRADGGDEATATFYRRWADDRLVLDKWFALQVGYAAPADAADVAARLTQHPAFDWKNPNRFRSVIGGLGGNHAGFHAAGGAGYELVADWLIRLDPVNPQTAARMTTLFETWHRYDADRRDMMRAALERIRATRGLSRDSAEMVGRILGDA
ncbi:aminopeptidase N [Mesobaculum littorinae]|uniref:Aminopeptidase N n=1 Tax=Mesobaculum littorinae TaxID=2486419 RepID=A0A438AJD1_9RHOB|nr:aminopeptidase N [Mesobaculum littorinae]RVV98792.1 aminopeptidase N [Mesobaculum littorinae]